MSPFANRGAIAATEFFKVDLTRTGLVRYFVVFVIDLEMVHYELPHSPQGYVHRAGRTGRAGTKGRSLVLVSDAERFIIKRLEGELGITFEDFRV